MAPSMQLLLITQDYGYDILVKQFKIKSSHMTYHRHWVALTISKCFKILGYQLSYHFKFELLVRLLTWSVVIDSIWLLDLIQCRWFIWLSTFAYEWAQVFDDVSSEDDYDSEGEHAADKEHMSAQSQVWLSSISIASFLLNHSFQPKIDLALHHIWQETVTVQVLTTHPSSGSENTDQDQDQDQDQKPLAQDPTGNSSSFMSSCSFSN